MEQYTGFAEVYDTFMDQTPYEEWASYIDELLKNYCEIETQSDENLAAEAACVLDLGCGTGTFTRLLAQKGYDMIGIDYSDQMLQIAMEKQSEESTPIMYLCQDMRDFELYGTVGAVVSVCDSINYLLSEEEVLECFRLVNNYLYPKGLFIFDFNTVYKYEMVIGDTTIAENREDCSFIWENYYHEEENINEYDLTIFAKDRDTDLFYRFQETHLQRGYTLQTMKTLIKQAGLHFIAAIDADTHGEVTKESERIYMICREQGK